MIIGNNPPYVFLAIPKTGTRSIYSVLEKSFNGHQYIDHHKKIPLLHRWKFSFTVVRNPYDRICSAWWATCMRGQDRYGYLQAFHELNLPNTLLSFLIVVQKKHSTVPLHLTSPQTLFIENNRLNKLLHFENLESEFNRLPFVSSYINLPHKNSTVLVGEKNLYERPSFRKLLTKDTCEIINEIYYDDFKTLNYQKIDNRDLPCSSGQATF